MSPCCLESVCVFSMTHQLGTQIQIFCNFVNIYFLILPFYIFNLAFASVSLSSSSVFQNLHCAPLSLQHCCSVTRQMVAPLSKATNSIFHWLLTQSLSSDWLTRRDFVAWLFPLTYPDHPDHTQSTACICTCMVSYAATHILIMPGNTIKYLELRFNLIKAFFFPYTAEHN